MFSYLFEIVLRKLRLKDFSYLHSVDFFLHEG